jgi:hypothetical protein
MGYAGLGLLGTAWIDRIGAVSEGGKVGRIVPPGLRSEPLILQR